MPSFSHSNPNARQKSDMGSSVGQDGTAVTLSTMTFENKGVNSSQVLAGSVLSRSLSCKSFKGTWVDVVFPVRACAKF